MSNKFLCLIALFTVFSINVNSQIDFSVLGIITLDLEIFSDGEKINAGSPILLKRNTVKKVYEGGASEDVFFLEFKAQQMLENKDYLAIDPTLKNKIIITFSDKVTKEKSEFAIDLEYMNLEKSFDNYLTSEVKYFYYSLNLVDVPLLMILESEQIEVRVYSNRKR